MDYPQFYDFVVEEQRRLEDMGVDVIKEYRLCKALAACYELQDYLANIIGEMVARGEIEDEDY